jgi:hypothetical protein
MAPPSAVPSHDVGSPRTVGPPTAIGWRRASRCSGPNGPEEWSPIDPAIAACLTTWRKAERFPAAVSIRGSTLTNGRSNARFLHFSEFSLHTVSEAAVNTHPFTLGGSIHTISHILEALSRFC